MKSRRVFHEKWDDIKRQACSQPCVEGDLYCGESHSLVNSCYVTRFVRRSIAFVCFRSVHYFRPPPLNTRNNTVNLKMDQRQLWSLWSLKNTNELLSWRRPPEGGGSSPGWTRPLTWWVGHGHEHGHGHEGVCCDWLLLTLLLFVCCCLLSRPETLCRTEKFQSGVWWFTTTRLWEKVGTKWTRPKMWGDTYDHV